MAKAQAQPSSALATDEPEKGEMVIIPTMHGIDPVTERRVVWKFDLRILPVLAIMYLFNSLDKSNMGNAKTAGLVKDLGLKGDQYNILLSVFFIPYVLTAPFLGLLGKKVGPSRILPGMMAVFGTMTLLTATVHNFSGLFAIRWFLGMSESAFFPLVIYYQTTFYRRGELARRLAIFYAGSSIASAFSGLLAFGTFQIKGGALSAWKYLFVVEGAGTLIVAIFAYWYLPFNGATASFLNAQEKEVAHHRLQIDSSSVVAEEFSLKEAVKIMRHPTSWVILLIQICLGVPLQGVQLYLPVIVKRLGYSTVKTNLYTVAPNISGAVSLLVLGFCSDFAKLRFPFVALGFALTFTGFIIYACINVTTQLHVAYFACFMMTWGTSAPSVILDVWYNNNIANENRRMFLTTIAVPVANVMGLVASNIFQEKDAPKYFPALITTAAFGGTGCIITILLGAWMTWDNKRRDKLEGVRTKARDIPTEVLAAGPQSPTYRWYL
ncbi:major facilitator superfamily transporter [Fusarium mexicanum]|uniref:Major facilitator superfamily transporter n=1 Tax=Fusarium mexicanum TaxID=751941 RepID=A0A8H5IU83_9HYPO|nr:major facilitator superfamily transporter [Fusarium mexicanum]